MVLGIIVLPLSIMVTCKETHAVIIALHQILPKNTAMNKEWYQHIIREQLLPTIQEQLGDKQCLFQPDGTPCYKAKVITK